MQKKRWMGDKKRKKVPKTKIEIRVEKGKENKVNLPTTLVSTITEKKSH
jgi:hypothetical protein